jgi:hypothetical protein
LLKLDSISGGESNWCYPKKVDTLLSETERDNKMDTKGKDMEKRIPKYDETFKKNLVSLHQNGKSQSELCREYGVSMSALSNFNSEISETCKTVLD